MVGGTVVVVVVVVVVVGEIFDVGVAADVEDELEVEVARLEVDVAAELTVGFSVGVSGPTSHRFGLIW
ncbi:MAG: hypothetical protein WBD02_03705 [Acidimicrobiia bacterium]